MVCCVAQGFRGLRRRVFAPGAPFTLHTAQGIVVLRPILTIRWGQLRKLRHDNVFRCNAATALGVAPDPYQLGVPAQLDQGLAHGALAQAGVGGELGHAGAAVAADRAGPEGKALEHVLGDRLEVRGQRGLFLGEAQEIPYIREAGVPFRVDRQGTAGQTSCRTKGTPRPLIVCPG